MECCAAPGLKRRRLAAHPAFPAVAVVNTLLPIFLIIGLGAALTAGGAMSAEFRRGLNWLSYWIGLPCLLFASVCHVDRLTNRPLRIFGVLLAGTLAAGAVAWVVSRMLRLPRISVGTFIQAAFRGNLALLALPVTIYAFSTPDAAESATSVVPVVALAIAPLMILYNIFAAIVLLASQDGADRPTMRRILRLLALHPLVLAIGAGLLVAWLNVPLPGFLFETIRTVGGIAVPTALLGIGGTLVASEVRDHVRPALAGALIKVVITPLAGVLLARALHFAPVDVKIIGILLAAPTAAVSFVMAQQMRGDAALASSMVVLTTLLSAGSLGVVLAML
jgi:malate permease and related proteins